MKSKILQTKPESLLTASKTALPGLHQNSSGMAIKEIYPPIKLTEETYNQTLGAPGAYPFTRGVHPTMYTGRFWTMRQYAGFGTAEETNKRYHFLLKSGQTGLSVAFDLPTQMGYDSDHPLSSGEVGKTGVAISTLDDMATLFKDIPLDKVSVSMTINATCPVVLAMYIALAEQRGIPLNTLAGTVQNDILKEYIARGAYIFPPQPSLKLVIDTMEYCMQNLPRWNFISVSGYHIREAGSTAAQELGFTLANGIAYVQEAQKRGLSPTDLGGRISFFFNAHNDLFEEIAKFRAARRLWARIMKERFNVTDPRAQMLRFHTQTAGCTLTAEQPENNVVRVALQAMAAVLGGTQSLHTNSYDEALALPTEKAAKIALRTQQLLAYETGVPKIVDPLAGSAYLENLTDELQARAEDYIAEVDKIGGSAQAIEQGYFQREIMQSAYQYQQAIEKQQRFAVGVNIFQAEERINKVPYLKINRALQQKQTKRVQRFKETRSKTKLQTALKQLGTAARQGNTNLIPIIKDCIQQQATLGEVCEVLRTVWGRFQPKAIF
jgi:methylmalonyl-CoA mutase N-terminal domain/subunit